MKKPKFKKIISALLSATIVCSTFTALPFSVSAAENETATATNDEAVSVKKAPEPVGAKVPSEQVGATSGNFEYSVKNNSVTITKYRGKDTIVEIPSEIDGYSVTRIGYYAFSDCESLTSIIIPDSVKNIEFYTFYGCTSITSITIPDSVTSIDSYAFYKSGLKTIYGKAGSYAETFAKNRYLAFIACTKGNIFNDNELDINDVTALQQYIAEFNLETFDETYMLAVADIDGDGKVNVKDATALQKYLVGITDSL